MFTGLKKDSLNIKYHKVINISKEKASFSKYGELRQTLSFMQATPTNQTMITKSYSVQKCFLPSLLSAPDKIYQHLQFYQQLVENNIFIRIWVLQMVNMWAMWYIYCLVGFYDKWETKFCVIIDYFKEWVKELIKKETIKPLIHMYTCIK